jgi:amino acid adenylation domain-containing protein
MSLLTNDCYSLSSTQLGTLLHNINYPHAGVYLQQFIIDYDKSLNIEIFKQAWQAVIQRHDILQTRFNISDLSNLTQVVDKSITYEFPVRDYPIINGNNIAEYLISDRKQGFDFNAKNGLMRFCLFKLQDNNYKFIWTSHHAIFDGRSRTIILKEFDIIYQALLNNNTYSLPIPRPYKDYIEWLKQQDFSNSCDLQIAKEFWVKLLADIQAPTPLLTDKNDNVLEENISIKQKNLKLSTEITTNLTKINQKYNLTFNTIAQTVWALLLSYYSGENKVVFGAVRACRYSALKNMSEMVGLFINTLPVSAEIKPNSSLLEVAQKLREQWIAMRNYEHTPATEIHKWSDIPKNLLMFNSMVIFESRTENDKHQLIQKNDFQLYLAASLTNNQLNLEINYNDNLFSNEVIKRMLGHLENILITFVKQTETKCKDLSPLSSTELQQIITWNDSKKDYPNVTLMDLFEAQVAKTPNAIALEYEDKIVGLQTLTYAEFNEKIVQFALYLQSSGVKSSSLVAILMERSLEMVIAIYAIIKAGGVYIPLDLEYPIERLKFILEDTQASFLVSHETCKPILEDLQITNYNLQLIHYNSRLKTQDSRLKTNKDSELAYIIYTSGSTGKPKGVMSKHAGICNLILAMQEIFKLSSEDKILQKIPYSYDASVLQLFWSLTTGASLFITPANSHKDNEYLLDVIAQKQITMTHFVPPMLRIFLEEVDTDKCKSLKYITCGGEKLTYDLQQKFFAKFNNTIELHNLYGPTETTVDITHHLCQKSENNKNIPIGRPFINNSAYILDKQLNFVPIGVIAELHIAGIQVAAGYLNRPELTAEKFINIENSKLGLEQCSNALRVTKLYKTGDLCRYLPDGNIEYIGRSDNQVKLRGFRIELGEIENALLTYIDINSCAVIVQDFKDGDERLIAYIVLNKNINELNLINIRKHLNQKIPDYMIPSHFVELDILPLLTSGKVNYKQLPKYSYEHEESNDFVAPSTELEQEIAQVWEELLEITDISIYDNFFDLGGHSLLSMQVIKNIFDKTGYKISARQMIMDNLEQIALSLEEDKKNILETTNKTSIFGRIKKFFK